MKNKIKLVFASALLVGASTIGNVVNASIKMTHTIIIASPNPVSIEHADAINTQLDCLAINIYREAGGEPYEGKVGVAQVTLNRVAHPAYPKDICNVVHQKKYVNNRAVCQFSWYCKRHRPVDALNYYMCREVARKVLLSGYRLHKFKDALYFHTVTVRPKWRNSFDMIGQSGHHLFYKPRRRHELMIAVAD